MKILFPLLLFVIVSHAPSADAWLRPSGCVFPDARGHAAPQWICDSNAQRGLVSAVGYAAASRAGFAFARNMAIADARVKLARRIQGQCARPDYTDAVLINSRVLNLQRSPSGGFYARVGLRAADLARGC